MPVSAGYFETMEMRLVRGRVFDSRRQRDVTEGDGRSTRRSRSGCGPAKIAIGKRLKQGWPENPNPWREVVGVVADVKFEGVTADTPMQVVHAARAGAAARRRDRRADERRPGVDADRAIEGVMRRSTRTCRSTRCGRWTTVLGASIARQRMSMLVFVGVRGGRADLASSRALRGGGARRSPSGRTRSACAWRSARSSAT